jgi:hypothetical protein
MKQGFKRLNKDMANVVVTIQQGPAKEVSIDSTNAGVDHSKSSYHFTAANLAHPSDRAGPEE